MECESSKLMEFPYSSGPVRKLMVDLVSTMERRLSPDLLPCTLPPDVQLYRNPNGSAVASLYIRSGAPSSPIEFMLGNWVHCKLANGADLNITALSCQLNDSTDSPNFQIEIYQTSPTTMLLSMDLCPRKDLALHPDYLKTMYEDTQLEKQRQLLYTVPEVQHYFPPTMYLRTVFSPTAILVRIHTNDSQSRLDQIIKDNVSPVANHFLSVWFDCVALARGIKVPEEERKLLKERDRVIKSQTIQIHLASNLPRMFGQETADRVLEVIGHIFNINSEDTS